MEEKNKLSDDVRLEPTQGSGSLLAVARKQQNRSVEEIADELNLSVTQIRTIELDQSEGLPEPTYVRGYIRSYAKLLGLDAKEVLDHYLNPNWQKGSRLDEMPRGIGSANESERGGFLTVGKVVTAVVLLSVISFLWFTGKLNGLFGEQTLPVAESEITVNPVPSTPTASDSISPVSSTNEATQTSETTLSNQTAQSNSAAPDSQASEAAQAEASANPAASQGAPVAAEAAGEHRLVLSFSDTSWVDIRDADGQRLAYKSYAEGESLDVSSSTKMAVFIGNAKAVSARYNGSEFDISQHREGVFARFSLGE